ncbi:restriction endonuclease subunit S [Stenotrophomonas maltophilia]|uniref:restriction endonuclease subunit S n=1 Tax=Stenotrophomonas maltophilia TaxID=40324 RepID=UPI0006AA56DF|nr:restriction endonuclease subunit S [Stenotrophomonas maltophilia]KOO74687.1 hypothetical protein VK66_19725 [Stenotrophomonas maltophilia]
MAGEWPYKRVEEIALKVAMGPFGSSIKVETFTDTGIPIISGQHLREAELTDGEFNFITEEHANSLRNANVERGDVIFTHAGNIGQVAFVPSHSKYERYVISQRQFYLRCDTNIILPEFVAYYFKSPEGQHKLLANANQVGVPSIARPSSYLRTIEVPVPSIEEQKTVVRNIKALDACIRTNRYISQTLQVMAQAIFKSWFVDFDPVKAKIAAIEQGEDALLAAMRVISGKTDDELDQMPRDQYNQLAATAALFPDAMEGSELGGVPHGWSVQSISDLTRNAVGKVDVSSLTVETYISTENMIENRGGGTHASSLPSVSAVPSFKKGQVLISNIRPYFKKIWMARFDGGRSNDVLCFEAKEKGCSEFLYNLLYQDNFFEFMMRTSKGAKMPRGDKDAIAGWKSPCAPLELRRAFSEMVRPFYSYIENLSMESRSVCVLRDTLLPRLLSDDFTIARDLAGEEGQ